MAYKILVSQRALKEIEGAIDYYALHSTDAPIHFIAVLQSAYNTLEINPFYKVCYKEIRALKLKRFPYSLYYVIDENKKIIHILSCFHNKRSPDKRPLND